MTNSKDKKICTKIKDPSKTKRKLTWKELEIGGLVKGPTALNNKTGSWKAFKPEHIPEKCINCMKCVEFCPDNCILVKKNDGKNPKIKMPYLIDKVNLDYCKGCGLCANVCPVDAIEMKRI